MRIGITGHQILPKPEVWPVIKTEIYKIISSIRAPIVGISSLAKGADQVFAKAILESGGTLEVVLPFEGYESKFDEGPERCEYQHYLRQASKVEILPGQGTEEESYFAAGKRVVDLSDLIIAVWDGMPARGLGGTSDIVHYARSAEKGLIQVDPHVRDR